MRFLLFILVIFTISCSRKSDESKEVKNQSEIKEQGEIQPGYKEVPTSFDHCQSRAINESQPKYINVCKTLAGMMTLDDYLRSLDNNSQTSQELQIIEEAEFLPEADYPSRQASIDRSQLSESLRQIAELGRVTDVKQASASNDQRGSSSEVNEQIRQINEARERLRRERELNSNVDLVNNLRSQLRSSNPVKRVGSISFMEALSRQKDGEGQFGEAQRALLKKMNLIKVEDIKSFKLIGVFSLTFLRAQDKFEEGDKEFAFELLKLSERLLDVGLGIVPGSKLVQDVLEVTFGLDIVSLEELRSEERGLSLVRVSEDVIFSGPKNEVMLKLADLFRNVISKFSGSSKSQLDEVILEAEKIIGTYH